MSDSSLEWSANQLAFQAWLATPSELREIKTQKELAEHLGLNENTLGRWKKLDGFYEAVNKIAMGVIKEYAVDILSALVKEAKSGSYQHIKLFLEVAELYKNQLDLTSVGEKINLRIEIPIPDVAKRND